MPVLYPSLFLYYIYDITVGLRSTIRLIAHDTISYMYMAMQSIIDAHYLQQDATNLQYGKEILKYVFHPGKCNVLSVTRNKNSIKYNYTLYGHTLE